jgi:hybrid polyketide synthase/nonribosomal peptide synthetase ACE1
MSDEDLSPQYWVDNMTNTVLFAPAVAAALEKNGSFDLVLEIGPHATLKGPCLDTLSEGIDGQIPYCGLLSRGQDDIIALSTALGFLWSNLDAKSVSFETFEKSVSGDLGGRHMVTDLPKYPFDNSKSFWSLSRAGAAHAVTRDPPHPILGRRCIDRETSHEIQWRNILSPKEISWLKGHKIQGQIVFPAAGFVAMAVEAMKAVAKSTISLIKIENLFIGRAIAFNDENSNVESLFSVKLLHSSNESIEAKFSCYSGGPHDAGNPMALNAEGTITVSLAEPEADSIAHVQPENFNMTEIEIDRFYEQFRRLEYEYLAPFRGILTIDRKNGHATGTLENQAGSDWEDQLLIHPGMLDTAFQSTSAAFSCPGDGHMWGLYIPAGIESIVINPFFAPANKDTQDTHAWEAIAKSMKGSHSTMDINIFSQDNLNTFIQVEGLELMPFTAARPENDAVLFLRFDYKIDRPNADLVVVNDGFSAEAIESAIKGERISFYYLRRLLEAITPEDKANTLPHYRHMLTWASHVVELVKNGKNSFVPANAQFDTEEQINTLFSGYAFQYFFA